MLHAQRRARPRWCSVRASEAGKRLGAAPRGLVDPGEAPRDAAVRGSWRKRSGIRVNGGGVWSELGPWTWPTPGDDRRAAPSSISVDVTGPRSRRPPTEDGSALERGRGHRAHPPPGARRLVTAPASLRDARERAGASPLRGARVTFRAPPRSPHRARSESPSWSSGRRTARSSSRGGEPRVSGAPGGRRPHRSAACGARTTTTWRRRARSAPRSIGARREGRLLRGVTHAHRGALRPRGHRGRRRRGPCSARRTSSAPDVSRSLGVNSAPGSSVGFFCAGQEGGTWEGRCTAAPSAEAGGVTLSRMRVRAAGGSWCTNLRFSTRPSLLPLHPRRRRRATSFLRIGPRGADAEGRGAKVERRVGRPWRRVHGGSAEAPAATCSPLASKKLQYVVRGALPRVPCWKQ